MTVSLQPVQVATGSADENGCLVFDPDRRLMAVLVQLSALHDGLTGQWFCEAAFHPNARTDMFFRDLETANSWFRNCLAQP